jgi:hypothetical protein
MFGNRFWGKRYFGPLYFHQSIAGASAPITRSDTLPSESDVSAWLFSRSVIAPPTTTLPPEAVIQLAGPKSFAAADIAAQITEVPTIVRVPSPKVVQFWSYSTADSVHEASSVIPLGTSGSGGVAPTTGNMLVALVAMSTNGVDCNAVISGFVSPTNGHLYDTTSGYEIQDVLTYIVPASPPTSLTVTYNCPTTGNNAAAMIWIVEVSGVGAVDIVTSQLTSASTSPYNAGTGTGIAVGQNDLGLILSTLADAKFSPVSTPSGYQLLSNLARYGDGVAYGGSAAVYATSLPITTQSIPSVTIPWNGTGAISMLGQQILLYPVIKQLGVTEILPREVESAAFTARRVLVMNATDAAASMTQSVQLGGPVGLRPTTEIATAITESGVLLAQRGSMLATDTTRITESAQIVTTHVLGAAETLLETESPAFRRVKPFSAADTAASISDYASFRLATMRAAEVAAVISEVVSFVDPTRFRIGDTATRIVETATLGVIAYSGPPMVLPELGKRINYRIELYSLSGDLIAIPQDLISGWFEDAVNGGNTQGYLRLERKFEDTSWIGYEARVKFYLPDSIDPWWDGRIVDFDQQQIEDHDAEYIDLNVEGWKTRLAYAVTSDSLNPGIQPNGQNNGTMNADAWLRGEIGLYLDTSTFGALDVGSFLPANSIPIILDKIQYDGTGLDEAINTVVAQLQDNTGNIFEWWVRGTSSGKPGLVVQPQQNPAKVSTGRVSPSVAPQSVDYVYEFKDATTTAYNIQNTGRNIYNMIALYGGTDPTTGQQVYGPFKDSTSISLYGVRQKKVTNNNIVSQQSLANYAAAYVLQNGYPQPMGTFKKVIPSDKARAGQWFQIAIPSYIGNNQVVQQVRCTKVRCDFGRSVPESIIQTVSVSAPRPYIDEGYYAAINQAKNIVALQAANPIAQPANYFVISGFNWIRTGLLTGVRTIDLTPPAGMFQLNGMPSVAILPTGPNPDGTYTISLADSVTGGTGDGTYLIDFAADALSSFGVGAHTPAYVVLKLSNGQLPAYDPAVLQGWVFTVIANNIVGERDLRVRGGITATNIAHPPSQSTYSAPAYTGAPTVTNLSSLSGLTGRISLQNVTITNVPQDGMVRGLAWFFRHTTPGNTEPWSYWGEIPIPGLPLPGTTIMVGEVFADLTAGDHFDFGSAFVSVGGDINTATGISTAASNVLASQLAIQSGYMANAGNWSPHVVVTAGPSPIANPNGATSRIHIEFFIDNQSPTQTNGAFSRITYWVRSYGIDESDINNNPPYGTPQPWAYYGSQAAFGLDQIPQPVIGNYAFDYTDMSNGMTWEIGVTAEDAQGNDTPNATNGRGQVIANPISLGIIGRQELAIASLGVPAAIYNAGPTLISSTDLGQLYIGQTSVSQQVGIQVSPNDYGGQFTNAAPDWMSGGILLVRDHATQQLIPGFSTILPPSPTGYFAGSVILPAGVTVDVGFDYLAQNGDHTTTPAWPPNLGDIAVPVLNMDNVSGGNSQYPSTYGSSNDNIVTNGAFTAGTAVLQKPGLNQLFSNPGHYCVNWWVEGQSQQFSVGWMIDTNEGPRVLCRLNPSTTVQPGQTAFVAIQTIESYSCQANEIYYVEYEVSVQANSPLPAGSSSSAYCIMRVFYKDGSSLDYTVGSASVGQSAVYKGQVTIQQFNNGYDPLYFVILGVGAFYNGSGAAVSTGNNLYCDARIMYVYVKKTTSLDSNQTTGDLPFDQNTPAVAGANGVVGNSGNVAASQFGTSVSAGNSVNPYGTYGLMCSVALSLPANPSGGGIWNIYAQLNLNHLQVTGPTTPVSVLLDTAGAGSVVSKYGFDTWAGENAPTNYILGYSLCATGTAAGGQTIMVRAIGADSGNANDYIGAGILQVWAVRIG